MLCRRKQTRRKIHVKRVLVHVHSLPSTLAALLCRHPINVSKCSYQCVCTRARVCLCLYTCVRARARERECECVCVCEFGCANACVCVCVCMQTRAHTHIRTHTYTHTHSHSPPLAFPHEQPHAQPHAPAVAPTDRALHLDEPEHGLADRVALTSALVARLRVSVSV
jgi:hypothetical protein